MFKQTSGENLEVPSEKNAKNLKFKSQSFWKSLICNLKHL